MRTTLRRLAYAASRGIAGALMIRVHCLVLFLRQSAKNLPHWYKEIGSDSISCCEVTEELDSLASKINNR
jgi:hypothetical protein